MIWVADLIVGKPPQPASDLATFAKALSFDYLIGNCDAHLKNHSLIAPTNDTSTLPITVYDLICTTYFERVSREIAMDIGGTRNIDAIGPQSFDALAKELSRAAVALRRICSPLAEGIVPVLAAAGDEGPDSLETMAAADMRLPNVYVRDDRIDHGGIASSLWPYLSSQDVDASEESSSRRDSTSL